MRITLGTPVRCSDGRFGDLADVVIDPIKRRVTHLVVRPRHKRDLFGCRLVPIELAHASEEGAEITLDRTVREIGGLEPVEEVAYFRLGDFSVEDPGWDVGIANVLAVPYYAMSEVDYAGNVGITYDRIPKDEVELRRSSLVISSDGHDLGKVEAFVIDEEDTVTHFVLERGHLWGRRDITIPISAVTHIETDRVTIGLTKDEVGALRAVRVHRW